MILSISHVVYLYKLDEELIWTHKPFFMQLLVIQITFCNNIICFHISDMVMNWYMLPVVCH